MECGQPLAPGMRLSLAGAREVRIGRGAHRGEHRGDGGSSVTVKLPDEWMSTQHGRLYNDGTGWHIADVDSKNGTFVDGVRVHSTRLHDGSLIELGNTLLVFRDAVPVTEGELAFRLDGSSALATLNAPLASQLDELARVARADVPVLVRGETGTGKEVIARAVHEASRRRGPFVPVNCGALPDTLIESELFGYRRGAFSGAVDTRDGLVRAADGGTLFLDEIAELSEPSQVALLRVLQEKEVVPLGGTRPYKVDVRVVAATHQDLEARIEQGRFRRDLYGRLAGFEMRLPPLRDRREDIGIIVATLLRRLAGQRAESIKFRRGVGRALFAYGWPLNIRELEHALQAAPALAPDREIALEHLPEPLRWTLAEPRHAPRATPGPTPPPAPPKPISPEDEALRGRLLDLLAHHNGNISAVARDMGKARVQIHRWTRRFGIEIPTFRR